MPGIGSFQSHTGRSERVRHVAHAQLRPGALLSERLQLYVKGFYSTANEQFHDPDGDITLQPQDTDNTFRNVGGNVLGSVASIAAGQYHHSPSVPRAEYSTFLLPQDPLPFQRQGLRRRDY